MLDPHAHLAVGDRVRIDEHKPATVLKDPGSDIGTVIGFTEDYIEDELVRLAVVKFGPITYIWAATGEEVTIPAATWSPTEAPLVLVGRPGPLSATQAS
jgi:hypothetical protein